MELPTYTNIWKIEKRLYKLYDFRLPMPLPIGQVAAFLAIAIPYMLILTVAGMPFSHTWVWLYVLPPGVLAWLVTRPVLEGKRLPELVLSQLRYLSEPGTWCRMAPLAEKDEIAVVARVWRRSADLAAEFEVAGPDRLELGVPAPEATAEPELVAESEPVPELAGMAEVTLAGPAAGAGRPVWPTRPALASRATLAAAVPPASRARGRAQARGSAVAPQPPRSAAAPEPPAVTLAAAPGPPPATPPAPSPAAPPAAAPGPPPATPPAPSPAAPPACSLTAPPASSPASTPTAPAVARPALTVRTDGAARPLHVVERALRSAPGGRTTGWHDRVVVVPGGHRPGKPDQVQRDQARARRPLAEPARIVVLGCTAGAGQTVVALLTGQLLTSLRGEPVAVLDLSPGPGSLTEQARCIPRLLPGLSAAGAGDGSELQRERGLHVVTADPPAEPAADAGRLIDAVVARYPLTIADPAAGHVPRSVQAADQLVLVAPASADAAGALAMTMEWLESHGHADLVRAAVTVLNGVSDQTAQHVDKAVAVAAGRCRALVRIPWDARLGAGDALGIPVVQAYTALAGVVVAGLADPATAERSR